MSIQPLLDPNNINNKSAIYYGFDITTNDLNVKTDDNAGYVNYKMPDLGAVGDIIQTDGSGNLFFTAAPTPPGSGIIYTGTLPIATGTHLKSNNPLGTTVGESIMIETATDISLQNGTISNCGGLSMTGTIAIGTNDITGTTGLIQGYNIPALNTTTNTALTLATDALPKTGGTMTGNIDMGLNDITNCDDITANKFIVAGGTNIQYLLADGTLLTSSANSGNSNFYLYKSIDTAFSPPISSGDIVYNNANQSLATVIYVSHLTRDNIDIEIFFENVSSLNDLYIQDQNNSLNYIRYNITGTPTIIPNDYILIPVVLGTSGGTGSTSFGTNHNVLLSIFTNSIETDVRISNLENKTQNQTAILNTTTFAGTIESSGLNMNTNKITNLATPTVSTDCANKSYVDSLIASPTTITSVGTGVSLLGAGVSPNYTTKSVSVSGTGISTSTSTSTDLIISSTALPTSGGTMTGVIDMNTNKITNLATPTLSTDCANKSYVDTAIIKNYANIGFIGNATTISLTLNTFVSMPPTFVNNITPIGFTLTTPVGGTLTYTGTLTKNFHITFTGNCAGSLLASPNLYVYIRKNGLNIPSLQTNLSFPNNVAYWTQYSGNGIISLSTNDIVSTVVASTVGTATFLFYQYSLSIIQIN